MKRVLLLLVGILMLTAPAFAQGDFEFGGQLVGVYAHLDRIDGDDKDAVRGFGPLSSEWSKLWLRANSGDKTSFYYEYLISAKVMRDIYNDANTISTNELYVSFKKLNPSIDEVRAGIIHVPFALNMSEMFRFGGVPGTITSNGVTNIFMANTAQGKGVMASGSLLGTDWMLASTGDGFDIAAGLSGRSGNAVWSRLSRDFGSINGGVSYVFEDDTDFGEARAFGLHATGNLGRVNLAAEFTDLSNTRLFGDNDFLNIRGILPLGQRTRVHVTHEQIHNPLVSTGPYVINRFGLDQDLGGNITAKLLYVADNNAADFLQGHGFEAALTYNFALK